MPAKISDLADFFVNNDNFLIVTHERPDGDALGSSFGLFSLLRENGKTAEVLLPEPLPERYLDFVPHTYRTSFAPYERTGFNWCVSLDNTEPERAAVGMHVKLEDFKLPLVNIDHHPDNRNFGKINLIVPTAAATAEIVFMIAKAIPGWKISPNTATLLQMGLVMDTGGFRFDNTSPAALEAAAELLRLKADHHKIINGMFFSKHLPYVQFEADLITNHLRLDKSGRFAWISIPDALIERYKIDMRNSEGLIEILRAIAGIDIVAILQRKDEGYKISLRSKDARYSVGKIARQLSGGGHELAAGCFIKTDNLEAAERILLAQVERVLYEVQS